MPLLAGDTNGAITRTRIAAYILREEKATAVAVADAAATLTVAQMYDDKVFTQTPTAARTLTTSTAALLVAGLTDYAVGTSFVFTIVNLAPATHTITVAAGTGCTIVGVATIANTTSASFRVRVDSATAYTLYRMN